MPKIYAHRGGSGYFAENTLKAFEFAIELGCAGAELDIHLTKDGEVVVHHNDKLNHKFARKADGNWITPEEETPLSQLTLEQVQQYTVGEPNPKTHNHKTWPNLLPEANQTIPTLAQVMELAKEKSDTFELIIEIKTDIFDTDQAWLPLVEKVLHLIQQNHFTQRIKFCSFNWNALLYIQQQAPDIPLWFTTHPLSWLQEGEVPKTDIPPSSETLQNIRQAWLSGNAPWYAGHQPQSLEDFPKVIKQLGGEAWFCYHTDATTANLTKTYDQQLKLATWSVNLRDADALEKLNLVDAICVDYPKYRFVKPRTELKNFLAIADQARKEKKWKQAEHYYQLILNGYPEQSPVGVYTGLAICQRMEKRYGESERTILSGLKLLPNQCNLLIEFAALKNTKGEYKQAYKLWRDVDNLKKCGSDLNKKRYKKALDGLVLEYKSSWLDGSHEMVLEDIFYTIAIRDIHYIIFNVFLRLCWSKEVSKAYEFKKLAARHTNLILKDIDGNSDGAVMSLKIASSFYLEDFQSLSKRKYINKQGGLNYFLWLAKFLCGSSDMDSFYTPRFPKELGGSNQFATLIKNKKVCVVGPADTGLDNGNEIDSYDVVIRLNFTSTDDINGYQSSHGNKTNVTYFNAPILNELDFEDIAQYFNNSGVFVVFRTNRGLLDYSGSLPSSRRIIDLPLTFGSQLSYHGIQRVVLDVLYFQPAELKIFNVDFFTGVSGAGSNRIATYKTAGGDIGYAHDPLQGLRLIKYLVDLGLVKVDSVAEKVLGWSDDEYISHLENLEKNNPDFLKNHNAINKK